MLTLDNEKDIELMKNYHRASDMIDFLYFFPEASYVKRLAIATDIDDYLHNKEYFDAFDSYRVDSPKDSSLIEGIESDGLKTDFVDLFKRIYKKNKHGVVLFFELDGKVDKRYMCDAGISVNINLYEDVCIEVVGKGFDGREISKGICVHERYLIPWFELKFLNIQNFHKYKIYQIDQKDYYDSRKQRIDYLISLGEDVNKFIDYIPSIYKNIPDSIWEDLIQSILVNLYKKDDILEKSNFKHFAIGGNVINNKCHIWQMYNKDRYN